MKTYDELKAAIERYGVHPVFGGSGELDAWLEQNPHELATFLVAMQELSVSTMLEIGTGWKGGLSRFLAAELGWDVTTVDVEDYGHSYPGVHYEIIDKDWDGVEYPVFPHRFDLVLIDAKPTYDAAKANWDYYGQYASHVIAIHDIAGLRDCQGVTEFWREIAYDGKTLRPEAHEIIDDSERRGGIGYVTSWQAEAQTIEPVEATEETAEPEPETKPTKTVKRLPAKKPAAKVAKGKTKAKGA